jgi:putative CocE/NonD family hydrolase
VFGSTIARPLAERGYQVLIQSTRGGFGSGGTFAPLRQEREDGIATLDWVVKQPWFGGSIVLVGVSYMGYVQWAVADRLPPEVKAMIPQVTESALGARRSPAPPGRRRARAPACRAVFVAAFGD